MTNNLDFVYNKMLLEGLVDVYKRGFDDLNGLVNKDMDDRLRGRIYDDGFRIIRGRFVDKMEGEFKDNDDFINRLKGTRGNRFIKDRFYNKRERDIYDNLFYKKGGLRIKDNKTKAVFAILYDSDFDKIKRINFKINGERCFGTAESNIHVITDDEFYSYINDSDFDISIIDSRSLDSEIMSMYPSVSYRPTSWGEYHKY